MTPSVHLNSHVPWFHLFCTTWSYSDVNTKVTEVHKAVYPTQEIIADFEFSSPFLVDMFLVYLV